MLGRFFVGFILGVSLLGFGGQAFADTGAWSYVLSPYVLLPYIQGDVSLGRVEGAEVDVDPGDVLKSLELGAMVQVEAKHESGFSGIVNYAFMKLGDKAKGPAEFVEFDADIFQGILEGFISYESKLNTTPLAVYAGARYWDFDIDVSANGPKRSLERSRREDWVDPVLGLRAIPSIAADWRLLLQADIGGFGVSADSSDFSWSVQGGILYDYSQDFSLAILYKALAADYEKGEPASPQHFAYDAVTQGPILGFVFRF